MMGQSLARRPQMSQCFGVPPCLHQQRPKIAPAITICRIGCHGLLQGRQGLLWFAHSLIRDPDAGPCPRVRRCQLDRTFQANDGLVKLPQLAVGQPQVVKNVHIAWLRLGHAFQIGDRLFESSALQHGHHEIQWRLPLGQGQYGDFVVINRDQRVFAFARVLSDKVGNDGVFEAVGANLTGITGQQAHVETREREFERKRLCAHG